MNLKSFISNSETETFLFAKELSNRQFMNKKVVLLSGNLGTGKTTFVKGVAKALGIEEHITSPTYTYMNQYPIPKQENLKWTQLFHFDLYRLPETSTDPELTSAQIGLEDCLENPNALTIIEWPERLQLQEGLQILFTKKESTHQMELKNG